MNSVRRRGRLAVVGLTCLLVALCWDGAGDASAALPAPAWAIQAKAQPTSFATADCPVTGESCDHYVLLVSNVGSAASSGLLTIKDQVPAGLTVVDAFLRGREFESGETLSCVRSGQLVECTFGGEVPSGDVLEVTIYVEVEGATPPGPLVPDTVSVEGGGAAAQSASVDTSVEAPQVFGMTEFGFKPYAPDGTLDLQAGDHPSSLSTELEFTSMHSASSEAFGAAPAEDPKSALAYLPLGMVGDPTALPQCPLATLESVAEPAGGSCPRASRVGTVLINLEGTGTSSPMTTNEVSDLYNVPPEHGFPAEFAFTYFSRPIVLYASLVHVGGSGGGYALRAGSAGIPAVQPFRVLGVSLTFFGDPSERNGGATSSAAFLTNPTSCSAGPLDARIETDSWQDPGNWVQREANAYPEVNGCERLQFHPTFEVKPETHQADTPSGYEFDVKVPQAPNVAPSLATPDLRDARVTLPSGFVLSPSAANGLAGCRATGPEGINIGSDSIGAAGQDLGDPEATELGAGHPGGNGSPYDDGLYHAAPGHCPAASEIGDVEVRTPLLNEPLEGHVYVAQPRCGGAQSPCTAADAVNGNLYGIYLEAAGSGAIVKLHGKVAADPRTGQLTTTFTENPQLPFEELRVTLNGGRFSALANPQICGAYATSTDFTPWSAPFTPDALPSSSVEIDSGPGGSPCARSEAEEPHHPSFEAGTLTPLAGSYSPFTLRLSRDDGSQRLSAINMTLPPGLTGSLTGIPYCPDAALAAAEHRSAAAERADPSCPAASEVGNVEVGAGPGPQPFYVQGHAYLAGPYRGAPLSLAVVTPAAAGPFDLGTVVVRSALYVNPETAQITVRSDPLPTILFGTPLDVRSIAVEIDRPGFTLNPTSCEGMAVAGEAISTSARVAPLTNRFQVGGCGGLRFAPKLSLYVKGSTKRAAKPALRAVLTAKSGEANIGRASVALPHSEFLEQAHLRDVCTRVQFNAGGCPAKSVYGHARVFTPLLDQPLEGPVYLGTGYGTKLPMLVADLEGQIRIILRGRIDLFHRGIRSTFETVPDAPVSKFVLAMKGGTKGLLVNSESLCAKVAVRHATVKMTGHNGKVSDSRPLVKNDCGKQRKAGHGGRRK
jgi:hypothetical protein